uniref:Uncharacterized protein n=1 Tax=Nelumbo nucifera TaxID=4432 RepID=A0A822YZT2_NELNU|nr:TPA_asm: hypothetical protein HUJ06_008661 [Nelumbo nucifera]
MLFVHILSCVQDICFSSFATSIASLDEEQRSRVENFTHGSNR